MESLSLSALSWDLYIYIIIIIILDDFWWRKKKMCEALGSMAGLLKVAIDRDRGSVRREKDRGASSTLRADSDGGKLLIMEVPVVVKFYSMQNCNGKQRQVHNDESNLNLSRWLSNQDQQEVLRNEWDGWVKGFQSRIKITNSWQNYALLEIINYDQ